MLKPKRLSTGVQFWDGGANPLPPTRDVGSIVSSSSGVWGEAPATKSFEAF